jgi:hypothetical protein
MLRSRPAIPQEEHCPVPEHILGQLYRSSSHGLDDLVAGVPPNTRAMLALYCYRRAHLQSIGLAIATRCNEVDLRWAGGHAGTVLFTKSREEPAQILPPSHYPSRRKVTLSTGVLRSVVQDEDSELGAA